MDLWDGRVDAEFGKTGITGMTPQPFDQTHCSLGEGPLWHPKRGSLFWFDINAHKMFEKGDGETRSWQFDDFVTAAGWVDETQLLVAKKGALVLFDLTTGAQKDLCALEAENPITRPNDGRADPYGGYWIGTMGIELEPDAGAIYRYYRGELRKLYAPWTIPNSTCFSPSGTYAYFTDTPKGKVLRQRLDKDGWPEDDPVVFLDLPNTKYRPDGAVVDANGNLWIAHYGYAKVTQFSPDGKELQVIDTPAKQMTCPAFGGNDLKTLFITSARQNLETPAEQDGQTLFINLSVQGQQEHQVIL